MVDKAPNQRIEVPQSNPAEGILHLGPARGSKRAVRVPCSHASPLRTVLSKGGVRNPLAEAECSSSHRFRTGPTPVRAGVRASPERACGQ